MPKMYNNKQRLSISPLQWLSILTALSGIAAANVVDYSNEDQVRLKACRQDPTWSIVDYNQCQNLMAWQPRDNLWRATTTTTDSSLSSKAPVVSDDQDTKVKTCLEQSFRSARETHAWARCADNAYDSTPKKCAVKSTKIRGHYYRDEEEDGTDEVVVLSDVLTEQEAFGIEALEKCVRQVFANDPRFYEAREFGNDTAPSYGMFRDDGGNYCTFLNGLIQTYLPGVAAATFQAIQLAYEQLQWRARQNLPPPASLGVHSAEFLQYKTNGKLSLHVDDDTIYSISIALSRFDEYEGGYFRLMTPEALFKVPRRSAIVFFGRSLHGVTDIQQGERKVFVMELWENADAPIGSARPSEEDVRPPVLEEGIAQHG